MPLPVGTIAAQIQCPHGIPATLVPSVTRVMIDGALPLVDGDQGLIAGCPFTVPGGKPQPCVTAKLTLTAQKVKVEGKAVLMMNPADPCESADKIVNGPALWANVQQKVLAT